MDIKSLIEPRGSESPASKKSSASVASVSTGATRTYTTAPSAYTPSPAYATASPAGVTASPAYGTASPGHGPVAAYSTHQQTSAASMQGGPVLPAIAELHRHADPGPLPQFRPLYSGPSVNAAIQQGPPGSNGSPPSQMLKRAASQTPLPEESPAKKQSKWTPEEDNLTIELRGQGMKWDDIAKRLPGRSSISCRLRYQNYLEKRAVWDEEKKNKLARLYARFKDQMWQKVATEMGIPWRSAESMHWQLGEQEMSARANAPVFQLHPSATSLGSPPTAPLTPASIPPPGPATHGFTPANAPQLIPHPPPPAPLQHQPPLPPPPPPQPAAPVHSYHQRTESGSSQGRRRSSSLGRRRADGRSRSSVPPHLGPTLPQVHPQSKADLISGALTAPMPESQPSLKREGERGPMGESFGKRRREDDDGSDARLRASAERSRVDRSPDRLSQRSGSGSVRSVKRGGSNEPEQATTRSRPDA